MSLAICVAVPGPVSEDPELRRQMGAAGHARARERFSQEAEPTTLRGLLG